MTPLAQPSAGTRLGERFRLEAPRADRGVGDAWQAVDLHASTRALVKLLGVAAGDAAARLRSHAARLSAVGAGGARGVPAPLGAGEWEGRLWLAYPSFEGRSLGNWLDGHRDVGARPTLAVARQCLDALCEAVAGAHGAGLVHGVLTPRSILLDKLPSDDFAVCVLDHGLRPFAGLAPRPWEQMAPEQERAPDDPAGAAADVFALGVVCVEVLTTQSVARRYTRHPWWHVAREGHRALRDLLGTLRNDVPPTVWDALAAALSAHPDERFPDAARFHRALHSAWQPEAAADDEMSRTAPRPAVQAPPVVQAPPARLPSLPSLPQQPPGPPPRIAAPAAPPPVAAPRVAQPLARPLAPPPAPPAPAPSPVPPPALAEAARPSVPPPPASAASVPVTYRRMPSPMRDAMMEGESFGVSAGPPPASPEPIFVPPTASPPVPRRVSKEPTQVFASTPVPRDEDEFGDNDTMEMAVESEEGVPAERTAEMQAYSPALDGPSVLVESDEGPPTSPGPLPRAAPPLVAPDRAFTAPNPAIFGAPPAITAPPAAPRAELPPMPTSMPAPALDPARRVDAPAPPPAASPAPAVPALPPAARSGLRVALLAVGVLALLGLSVVLVFLVYRMQSR